MTVTADGVSAKLVQPTIYRGVVTPISADIGDLWEDTSSRPPVLKHCTAIPNTFSPVASGGGGGSGTVTSVVGTGTVNGISLSGTVTSSGNLTLSGTLDLSSPPAIGSTAPNAGAFTTLSGNAVTSTTPVLSFNGSNTIASFGTTTANSYNQLIIQNKSKSNGASTNYVLSNNLGTDSTYYGEFGMNASTYSAGTPADFFSLNNGVYFSAHDGDVTVGSGNGYKTYLAWGSAGQSAHVINASGAIGLNTSITGATNFGTSGQLMQSAGSAATPTWSSALMGLTIDNSVIGETTAAAGTFTTLSATTPIALSSGGTGKASAPAAQANLLGYTSVATATGTTTLDNTSSFYQIFTGTLAQTVVLPVTSTLQTGWSFRINNSSTGALTVQSSGLNAVVTVVAGTTVYLTCINTGVTDATGWRVGFTEVSAVTGTGSMVLNSGPSISNITLTGTLSLTGTSNSTSVFHSSQSTASMSLGGTTATGIARFGQSTAHQPIQIGGGITAASTTASGTASSITTTVLTVGGTVTGTFSIGMAITGTGVAAGTYILSLGTGAGGAGTYNLNKTQTVASTTITGTTAKSIDIGVNGASGSVTNITLGSDTSGATSTTTLNGAFNYAVNTVTVTANAGTIPVGYKNNKFTNSSAATMAITMAVTGVVDGQMTIVRIYDFSAASQTIGWTNTEDSTVTAPTTSNGSTTLPLTVGFMYNSVTSKWRCIAKA